MGCGKGFLLYEFSQVIAGAKVVITNAAGLARIAPVRSEIRTAGQSPGVLDFRHDKLWTILFGSPGA